MLHVGVEEVDFLGEVLIFQGLYVVPTGKYTISIHLRHFSLVPAHPIYPLLVVHINRHQDVRIEVREQHLEVALPDHVRLALVQRVYGQGVPLELLDEYLKWHQ